MTEIPPENRDIAKENFLGLLKRFVTEDKVISGAEIVNFLATDCGEGATADMIAAVSNAHDINDECELDDHPRCSPGNDGVWVAAWLWAEYPRCGECRRTLGRFCADEEDEADLLCEDCGNECCEVCGERPNFCGTCA